MPDFKKFEYVGVVCFTGYVDRQRDLSKELVRVGLNDVHYHWDFPSPYKDALKRSIPMTRFNAKNSCFFIGLNNYKIIATAYHLGYRNVLVMEDDIRFLRDLNLLDEIISCLPEDYDLAMLDHSKPGKMLPNDYLATFKSPVQRYWYEFSNLRSSGCYAMSRKGMERYLSVYELAARGQAVLRNNDFYFSTQFLGTDMHLYAACPAPAIQYQYHGCHCQSMTEYYSLHKALGLTKTQYQGFQNVALS